MKALACFRPAGEGYIAVPLVHRAHGPAVDIVQLLAAHLSQQHHAPALASVGQGYVGPEPAVFPAAAPGRALGKGGKLRLLRLGGGKAFAGDKALYGHLRHGRIQVAGQFLQISAQPRLKLAATIQHDVSLRFDLLLCVKPGQTGALRTDAPGNLFPQLCPGHQRGLQADLPGRRSGPDYRHASSSRRLVKAIPIPTLQYSGAGAGASYSFATSSFAPACCTALT